MLRLAKFREAGAAWIGARCTQVRRWYHGKTMAVENDPSSLVVFHGFHTERHWTALCARALVEFYLAHWKWLWSTMIAVAGVAAAVYAAIVARSC